MISIDYGTHNDIELWMHLVQKVSSSFPGLETETALAEHRQTVLDFMSRQEAVCAKQNGEIVGVLLFSKENNMLCFLAVDPACRRQHIAEKLFHFMLPQMNGDKPITVTTYREGVPEGIAARAFYQKLGFVPGKLTVEFGSEVQEFILKAVDTMTQLTYITLRQRSEIKEQAAHWFHQKWGVPKEAYLECMDDYLSGKTEYGWYLCLEENKIVGGLGVIENDFHDRKDLAPNICAVYTESEYRCKGVAGQLLDMAVSDLRSKGVSPVYLLTDHTGFYERYGWEFLCMVQGDGEPQLSRMYIHR